jgi:hypothetical protein
VRFNFPAGVAVDSAGKLFVADTANHTIRVSNNPSTVTAVSSSGNPSVFGQSVTFTATVTPVSPAAGTPTGTVTFLNGKTTLGTGTLNNSGVTTWSTTNLPAGTYSVTAMYGGDANFNPSTSLALAQMVNNPCVPVPTNIVLWLPFDEKTGATLTNLVPIGNNGTPVSAPVSVGGFVANSLNFNGTNQYVTVPDYPAINFNTNDFSMDAWIRRDPNSGNSPRIIIDKRDARNIGYSLSVSFDNLLFQLCDSALLPTNYRDTGVVPADNQWHFVAVTISRGSTNGGLFYIDGNPTGTFDPTGHPGSLTNTNSFLVGNTLFGGAFSWMGGIDEVEMFNRVLTPAEIATIFNAGSAGKCKEPCAVPLIVNYPTNKTVECGTSWSFDPPTAKGADVTITSSGFVTNGICPKSITQSWLITAACGNSTTSSQTVTQVDTTPPTINCPTNKTVGYGATWTFDTPAASDACSGTNVIIGVLNTVTNVLSSTITRTWLAVDLCGNANTCSQTVTVAPAPICVPPPGKLILWLPFDETSGTVSANLGPSSNNGTQVGGPSVVSGYVDHSLAFNGTSQYVSVPSYTSVSIGTLDLTIDAWIKRDPSSGNSPRIIVDKRDPLTDIGYSLAVYNGNLLFQMADAAFNYSNYFGMNAVPTDGQWHFVAVTVSRHATNGGSFYLDGIPSGTFDPTSHTGSIANTNAVLVGNTLVAGAGLWMGGIDEVEVFDRALAPTEITSLFTAGSAGKCKASYVIPLIVNCSTNKTVECGSSYSFDLPTATGISVTMTSSGFVTNGVCPKTITQSWLIADAYGNSNTCSQTVTLVDTTPPVITIPTNTIIVALDKNCQLEIPTIRPPASDNCTPASQLIYTQNPTNGTIATGLCQTVTVTVTDACGNSSKCQVQVCGQDKTPPTLNYPKTVTATNCIVPNVLALVSASDPCTASNKLIFTQSPSAGTPIAAGGNQVSVTVTDPAGNATTVVIPLTSTGPQSFLNVMFNTAVDSNKLVLSGGAGDPHYTLGSVPVGTLTGAGYYNAPNATVWDISNQLPPTTLSQWIAPFIPNISYPLSGSYTYTNRFVLPPGADPLTASISGRWASFIGTGTMYFNGSSMPVSSSSMNLLNLISLAWTHFIINSNFLAYPATNTITFVVTIPYQDFTGLRVEFTDASVSCGTCTPPSITQKTLNQSLPLNSTAVFSVGVWGTPPLTLQWYHNGLPLTNGVHYPNGVTNTTLTITPLGYADAGTYYIAVTNSCGGTTSTPSKLTITKGWPWPWAWWNFAQIGYPMKAAVGPDLIMDGTNIFGVSSGTTDDYGLPGIGGKTANAMYVPGNLPVGTFIQLPFIAYSDGGDTVSNYTIVMDFLIPDGSTNPITLFSLVNDGAGGQRTFTITVTSPSAGNSPQTITIDTGALNSPVTIPVTLATTMNGTASWNRATLAVAVEDINGDGLIDGIISLSVNGESVGRTTFNALEGASGPVTITGVLIKNGDQLVTVASSPDGTNGGVYVSSIAFFDYALPSATIASIGGSEIPFSPNDPSGGGMSPHLSVTKSGNGVLQFMWTGDSFDIEVATDLSKGDWESAMMPFTQSADVTGTVTTTASTSPTNGPTKFYRLIYEP